MVPTGRYLASISALAVTGAITLIQIKAGSTHAVRLLRAWLNQSSTTTSARQRIQIARKTAAATVTSFTPIKLGASAAAAAIGGTSATGYNASAEGTDGDILLPDAFDLVVGWEKVWVPEERIVVPPGGIIAMTLPAAPGGSTTFSGGIVFDEIG